MRAPFQVLVFPFRLRSEPEYAVFRRADAGYWQGIAGGGETGETILQAAQREAHEEAGIPRGRAFLALDTVSVLPVEDVCGLLWGPDVRMIPEHCFGVHLEDEITIGPEHAEARWLPFADARAILKWESNRDALSELNARLSNR